METDAGSGLSSCECETRTQGFEERSDETTCESLHEHSLSQSKDCVDKWRPVEIKGKNK